MSQVQARCVLNLSNSHAEWTYMRFVLALALSMCLAACSDGDMEKHTGPVPWHMWGDSKVLEVPSSSGAQGQGTSTQIVRINYKRPETWRFVFVAELLGANKPLATGGSLIVTFPTTLGVGRSSVTLPLGTMTFTLGAGAVTPRIKYLTQDQGPPVSDAAAAIENLTTTIVSEDIQVGGQAVFADNTSGESLKVRLSAFFAPNAHIRPEWYLKQFSGNETDGN